MASIYWSQRERRWVVRWNSLRGFRASKRFKTQAEADAHLLVIDERPAKKRGGSNRQAEPIQRRIRRLVAIDGNGCWLWQAKKMPREGYALMNVATKTELVHRVSYEAFIGPIGMGLQLDHLCRVRHCVNPAHLEPVTARVNVLRSPIAQAALNAAKTHCPQGHPYDEANTYLTGPHGRWRLCRACARQRSSARYALKRGNQS